MPDPYDGPADDDAADGGPAPAGEPSHVPVLLERCLALLAPALERPGAVVVDATLGLGGHSEALLTRFPDVRLVGIDRDADALARSSRRLAAHAARTVLVHAVYDELPRVLDEAAAPRVDGVLFDLGVSSMQLDQAARGFAYAQDAPLDMRMDPTRGITAAEVLNTYAAAELARVLRDYGEERFARRIADAVVRERGRAPFDTSARLVELVRASIPAPARRTGGNPAKRTFQALRIEVNAELEVLERAVPAAVDALRVGGRVVVLSYQSLEDRIVKRALVSRASTDVPDDLPFVPAGHEPELRLLTRGAEKASDAEIAANPRAASVRLRAAERLREAA
ncbi:MAG: 16S rRNA (cytosine(1402)-N(4))-methyltransferase RsmH [Frankiales bacterium]|nr:16S rRNA (cytosine(1402)-N(4))-methyltransferase RsmH [Frankiales bacterium]